MPKVSASVDQIIRKQRSDVGRGKQIASRTRRKDGPMTAKTSETIIEVAALRHKIDHPSDDDVRPNDLNTLKLKLASLEPGDVGLVEMVGKLMNGMRYSLSRTTLKGSDVIPRSQ